MEGISGAPPETAPSGPATSLLPSIELVKGVTPSTPPRPMSSSRSSRSSMKSRSSHSHSPGRGSPSSAAAPTSASGKPKVPASESRRKPTFTTARSYPEYQPTVAPSIEPEAELQRSQRRAKVAAVSKIDKVSVPTPLVAAAGPAATSLLPASVQAKAAAAASAQAQAGPSSHRNPLLRPQVVNPPFDIETVRTEAPRHAPSRARTRMFGLDECPVYYPTATEFADPMAYIESIGPEAKQYGMCKIVPPEGWHMPFTLDTSTFRFKTRLQRINSLEAASRAKLNFLDQLTMYHLQQGNAKVAVPLIGRVALDLWRLRKEAAKLGGFHAVEGVKAWGHIAEMMGFGHEVAHELRTAYLEIILPFETFAARAKSASASPLTPMVKGHSAQKMPIGSSRPSPESPTRPTSQRKTRMSALNGTTAAASTSAGGSRHVSGTTVTLPIRELSGTPATPGPKVKIPGFNNNQDGSDSDLSSEGTLSPPPPVPGVNIAYQKGEVCELCHGGHAAEKILLCDGCDRGYHTYCLDPPLASVPTNEEWFCTPCLLSQGDDYGFEEGDEHSVASFQARDSAFAYAWWNKHKPTTHRAESNNNGGGGGGTPARTTPQSSPGGPDPLSRRFGKALVSEDDVEREFWRLTESLNDTVEIEYGADVHSTTHGSAAPTLETHPLDPYAKDGWNLNNMPILPESLLRYIKSDISGMTVPWIYLGMLFSAFCWHNEDHYTYSVNYMFWGETKTWYGIPGDDAAKFEEAIKSEAPELFEQQPGLLYQLVTMMSPGKVKEAGVRVVACDQRPNEFVITFPKAYHCGFNHGINFNEAVNFALPDWLPDGRESVLHYKQFAKAPVFSHNELLITITLFSETIKTALWLEGGLAQMVQVETARREKLRSDISHLNEKLVEEDCPEEQYQCCVCKGFCYLSQVTCTCTKAVTCVEHAAQLCGCPLTSRTLRKRYSEAQLEEILSVVQARAAIPSNWRSRLDSLLETARPALKSMRALLSDGEKIPFPLEELVDLRTLVDRANAWVDRASALMSRKTGGRRRKGKADDDDMDLDGQEQQRSVGMLLDLLREAERLAFDAPEILQLRQMLASIENFKSEAQLILTADESELDLDKCHTALILGRSLNIDMPEIAQMETIVNRLKWFRKVEEEVDDRAIQYHEVLALLEEARTYEVPAEHPTVVELSSREQKGREWKEAVERLEAADKVELSEIDALIDGQELTPTDIDTMRHLQSVRKTAQTWATTAASLVSGVSTPAAIKRLAKAVSGASGLLSKIVIPDVVVFQQELAFQQEWERQVAEILGVDVAKIGPTLQEYRQVVENLLDDRDDMPNPDHTCYCRRAAQAVMVSCEMCKGAYHPRCIGVTPKNASEPFKCTICRGQSDPERPSLSRLVRMTDWNKWQFSMVPPYVDSILAIGEVALRFMRFASASIEPAVEAPTKPNSDLDVLVHLARKMWSLPVLLDAVDSSSNDQVIFDEWLYKRIQDARYPVKKTGRPRKPKLVLRESNEGQFSCICSTPPLDQLLTVTCLRCSQGYHASCVRAPLEAAGPDGKAWRCPCCSVNEGKAYSKNVVIRVQLPEHRGTAKCIDYRSIINGYRSSLLFMTDNECKPHVDLTCTELVPPYIPDDFDPPTLERDGRGDGLADEDGQQAKKRRKTKMATTNGGDAGVLVVRESGFADPVDLETPVQNGLYPRTAETQQTPVIPPPAQPAVARSTPAVDVERTMVPAHSATFPWAPRPHMDKAPRPTWQPPSASTIYTSPLPRPVDQHIGNGVVAQQHAIPQ